MNNSMFTQITYDLIAISHFASDMEYSQKNLKSSSGLMFVFLILLSFKATVHSVL